MKKELISLIAILLACVAVTGCKNMTTGQKHVKGTLEEQLGQDRAPRAVSKLLDAIEKTPGDERFEAILDDKKSGVSVWGLMKCSDEQSSEGYGVTIVKDGVETDLKISHGKMPNAYYDEKHGRLWFSGGVMEGTGTQVERPYLIRFDKNNKACIVATIDPYDMQQELCKRMTYSIEGKDITFYADGKPLTTVTSNTEDMGEFYDDPVWIGEQISYLTSSKLTVIFVPGISFVTGKVLIYDDMPTFAANVDLNHKGVFKVSDIRLVGDQLPEKQPE